MATGLQLREDAAVVSVLRIDHATEETAPEWQLWWPMNNVQSAIWASVVLISTALIGATIVAIWGGDHATVILPLLAGLVGPTIPAIFAAVKAQEAASKAAEAKHAIPTMAQAMTNQSMTTREIIHATSSQAVAEIKGEIKGAFRTDKQDRDDRDVRLGQ